jgi:hypothetical protein
MIAEYDLTKFFHVLIAILALGTSAGLGIVQEFYGSHPTHGAFVLRAIERIVAFFVAPGYALVLATGLWMAELGWGWTTLWVRAAVVLWVLGATALAGFVAVLHTQIAMLEAGESASRSYRRMSVASRALGAALGVVVVAILFLMIFKPT